MILDDDGQSRYAVHVHLTRSLETMQQASHSLRAITTESVSLDKLKYSVSLPLSLATRAREIENKIYILHGQRRVISIIPGRCFTRHWDVSSRETTTGVGSIRVIARSRIDAATPSKAQQ